MQTYSSVPSRNLIKAAVEMLEHAEPITVLGSFCDMREMPKRSTDTLVFRRVMPIDAAANGAPDVNPSNYVLSEGVNPIAGTITYQDVSVQLVQYGVLRKLTKKTELMYEDNVPADMVKIVGEHMATLSEMIQYGVVKGGTNVLYTNGSGRTAVNTVISLAKLRQAARQLEAAHAMQVTKRLAPGAGFGTAAVGAAFLVFIHTDLEADFRNLPGFVPVEEYGTFKPAHDREIGKVEKFRVITSPYFKPWLASGGNPGTTVLPATGSQADVYPVLVVGEEAWGGVALKGYGSVNPTYLPPSQRNHANPLGQFGYVGADFFTAAVRLNEQWMVRIECAASAL